MIMLVRVLVAVSTAIIGVYKIIEEIREFMNNDDRDWIQ